MDRKLGSEKIIAYTRRGKPIYEQCNHPENIQLTSTELQHPAFQAHDDAFYHSVEMKKYPVGSAERELHKVLMDQQYELYKLLGKLWRSAVAREKKISSKR